jgi:hypothetical protein
MRSKQKSIIGFDELIAKRKNLIPVFQSDLKGNKTPLDRIYPLECSWLKNFNKRVELFHN